MVTARVTRDSRNRRPTDDRHKEKRNEYVQSAKRSAKRMVNPICSEPLARLQRRFAFLDIRLNVVFDHDDGVVEDEAGRNCQGHE